ncbi:DUF1176 domain-containing protein [Pseudomonas sp. Fl5BN2]|uniref:DUF1176 domain-containing protein n=1 Tax=Pseudomonas sp. Fl5BN2 TaxID=2697652 RepID=UPI00137672DA|nr:DUF1176 domain-containing protein [Pseudomonas sp. Fl5BN2]NBF03920.1 DUF1176 domain-containing protein [Pseudomonas sp. Fl5BN2]
MLRTVVLSLLVLGALPCQARELPEQTPLWLQQEGWISACDNRRDCQLLYAPNIAFAAQVNHLTLKIRSQVGPEGRVQLQLEHQGAPFELGALRLDGQPLEPGLLAALVQEVEAPDSTREQQYYRVDDQPLVRQWLARLRAGQVLELPGEEPAQVLLKGLPELLQGVDQAQQRQGTVSALAAPGEQPNSAVPRVQPAQALRPYPGVKPLSARERAGLLAAVQKTLPPPKSEEDDDYVMPPRIEVYPLTAQQALVFEFSDCGAYICLFDISSRSRTAPYGVQSLQLQALPAGSVDNAGGINYYPETGVLSSFLLGRGVGDCGEMASWHFDGQAFQLTDYRRMPSCSGLGYEDWPVLWSAEAPKRP